jgi:MFS family permease
MASQKLTEWRQNWYVVAGAFIGMGTGYPAWASYGISSFFLPLQKAFGWSRSEIALAITVGSIAGAVCAPFLGHLVDRFGARRLILIFYPITALCFIALANMPASLPVFYTIYGLFVIAGMFTTGLTFGRLVAGRFDESRGLALSIARMGISACGAALPILLFAVITHLGFGWRGGFYAMAAVMFFIGWPISWLLAHDRQDSGIPATSVSTNIGKANGIRLYLVALADYRVIALCVASGLAFCAGIAITTQLQPMLAGQGINPAAASGIGAALALSTAGATLVVGFLLDRFWGPLVGAVFTICPIVGCLILMGDHVSPQAAMIAVIFIGLAMGAEWDVIPYLTARYFGMKSFGIVYGIIALFLSLGAAVFNPLFARIYEIFGSYQPVLGVGIVCYIVSAASFFVLGPYPKPAAEPNAATSPSTAVSPAE